MTQDERVDYLIEYLLSERLDGKYIQKIEPKFQMLRSLMNPRMPGGLSEEFLEIQDQFLRQYNKERGEVLLSDMDELMDGIYLWRGDITRIKADAIVNAANSRLLGCMAPLHNCIDNAIHTYAGLQLREDCDRIIKEQGHMEETGQAKVTSAYNLPSKFVVHTVGPIVAGRLTDDDRVLLKSCYSNCMKKAYEAGARSIAFCCISTGVFAFPKEEAAKIATRTVLEEKPQDMKVIFNVFSVGDEELYRSILV